jgi:hypothetical protein
MAEVTNSWASSVCHSEIKHLSLKDTGTFVRKKVFWTVFTFTTSFKYVGDLNIFISQTVCKFYFRGVREATFTQEEMVFWNKCEMWARRLLFCLALFSHSPVGQEYLWGKLPAATPWQVLLGAEHHLLLPPFLLLPY